METTHNSTFARVAQLAYVTNDMDRALKVFADVHGIPRFLDLRDLKLQTGEGAYAQVNLALAIVDGMEIEVIQPLGGADSVYRAGLTGAAFEIRFHHSCRKVEGRQTLAALRQTIVAQGREVVLWGSSPNGAHYFYVDDRATLGHYSEYIHRDAENLPAFMARIPTFASTVASSPVGSA